LKETNENSIPEHNSFLTSSFSSVKENRERKSFQKRLSSGDALAQVPLPHDWAVRRHGTGAPPTRRTSRHQERFHASNMKRTSAITKKELIEQPQPQPQLPTPSEFPLGF
jgi:hypothetical protein